MHTHTCMHAGLTEEEMASESTPSEPERDAQFDAVFAVLDRLEKEEVLGLFRTCCLGKIRFLLCVRKEEVVWLDPVAMYLLFCKPRHKSRFVCLCHFCLCVCISCISYVYCICRYIYLFMHGAYCHLYCPGAH